MFAACKTPSVFESAEDSETLVWSSIDLTLSFKEANIVAPKCFNSFELQILALMLAKLS